MKEEFNLVRLGHWAFLAGLALAVLAGFTSVPYLSLLLFFSGLAVGLLNITEKEGTNFLVAVIALLLIGVAGLQFGQLTGLVVNVLENFVAFISAAGLIVALKQIVVMAKPVLE